MKIETRHQRGVTILDPSGDITVREGRIEVRAAISAALAKGSLRILVNLGGVTAMDSTGIDELISAGLRLQDNGGQIKLANLPPKVTDLPEAARLIGVFEMYDDEIDALTSF